jgi:hypothetical protein
MKKTYRPLRLHFEEGTTEKSHAGASIYLCYYSSGLYFFYINHYPFPYSKNKKTKEVQADA